MEKNQETVEFYENQCCVCYTTFWQKKRGRIRRTCSAACKQRLYRVRHPGRGYEKKKNRREGKESIGLILKRGPDCPMCGTKIEQPKRGRKRKVCSEVCRKRLWRRQNPRCLVCGEHFKRSMYQKQHYYCTKKCKQRATRLKRIQKRREREWAKMAGYRPPWRPISGSGYREEVLEIEDGAEVEIVREREPKPNYEHQVMTDADWAAHEAEQLAELEEEKAALKAKKKQEEEGRRFFHFLFDTDW